ncbi:MAG: phosphodiester glycosidase family protein [Proteobacteria bacterium]|nr:phosphodiester glycosidase family protein [Pseudomonadota bacterium]
MRKLGILFALWALAATPSQGDSEATPPCSPHMFEGSSFAVCAFDSRSEILQLAEFNRKNVPLRSFANLSKELGVDEKRVRFAMNAGMFGTNGIPIGLYVEGSRMRHALNRRTASGNFYMKPNGVFSLGADKTVRVETTEAFSSRAAAPLWATQSGPMLVIAGALHPQITPDGSSRFIRNGVGIRDAHTALFVISDEPVSFGKLARFLRDGLKCKNALYLDGAISSLWVPSQNRQDDGAPLGPIVVVMVRN